MAANVAANAAADASVLDPTGAAFALEITDVLDLHTFRPREIAEVVTVYLAEARAKRFSMVRIIHGKGSGVQRARVQSILMQTPFVVSFQDAPAETGGWGATLVRLHQAEHLAPGTKEPGAKAKEGKAE